MARKSNIVRDEKRKKLIMKYAKKRAELVAKRDYEKLRKLPRNSSSTRWKNRCKITGRPRGYLRHFQISRIVFRELASQGEIMGIRKSSW